MKKNRPKHRNSNRLRVLTFDDPEDRKVTLSEYINSLKTSIRSRPSNNSHHKANTSRAVKKSRSCSAVSIGSISNTLLRKCTRSTLSLEDLKRFFLINNVFSVERPQSSKIFSKKRSARTKVKKGEEYLNKWDRDLKVLYTCESKKRPIYNASPYPNPSTSEISASPVACTSSGEVGLLIDARNRGRKQSHDSGEPSVYKYRSKHCTVEKVSPYLADKSPSKKQDNKTFQNRTSCSCYPCKKVNGNDCTCCFHGRKPGHPKTGNINTIRSDRYNHKTKFSNNMYENDSPKGEKTDPKNNNQTYSKLKQTDPKADYAETQISNGVVGELCRHKHKPLGSNIDHNNTQMNKYPCGCLMHTQAVPKTGIANRQTTSFPWGCPKNCPKKTQVRPKIDFANTQTIDQYACGCRKKTQTRPEINFANTQTTDKHECGCPKQTQANPIIDYAKTQTTNDTCIQCDCFKQKLGEPETSSNDTPASDNKYSCGCPKQEEASPNIDYAKTQTTDDMCTQCYSPQQLFVPINYYTNMETLDNKNTCHCLKQEKNTCPVCGCDKRKDISPKKKKTTSKKKFADAQRLGYMFPKCCTCTRKEAGLQVENDSNQTLIDWLTCGCSKQKRADLETCYPFTQTSKLCTCNYPAGANTGHGKLETPKNTCTKTNKKKRCCDAFEAVASQRDNNKMKKYFCKLRRRNLDKQIHLNILRRQKQCRTRRGRYMSTDINENSNDPQLSSRARREAVLSTVKCARRGRYMSTDINENSNVPQLSSQARREAVLSTVKCACCVAPIFPDSSTDTCSPPQLPCTNVWEKLRNTTAQTSKSQECTYLQKILKNQDDIPNQKRQYVLYYNNMRGWLVKPLRMRHSIRLSKQSRNKMREDESSSYIESSPCTGKENYVTPTTNQCNCGKNIHECVCSNKKHECVSSKKFHECISSSPNQNPISRNDTNICLPIGQKSIYPLNGHDTNNPRLPLRNNFRTDVPENNYCNNMKGNTPISSTSGQPSSSCQPSSLPKPSTYCNVGDHNVNNCGYYNPNVSRKTDYNVLVPGYPYIKPNRFFMKKSFDRFCECFRKADCNADKPYQSYSRQVVCNIAHRNFDNPWENCRYCRKLDCNVDNFCEKCRYSRNVYNPCQNNRYSSKADYSVDNPCENCKYYRNAYYTFNDSCKNCSHNCNCRNKRTVCYDDSPQCSKSRFKRFCACFRKNKYNNSRTCQRADSCHRVDPCDLYSQPLCPNKDHSCRPGKSARSYNGCKTLRKRCRLPRRKCYDCCCDKNLIGCDWLFRKRESCCQQCCKGCGKCCRMFWLTVAAIILSPCLLVAFICFDFCFPFRC